VRLFSRNAIDVHEAHELLEGGNALALDVREPAEWRAGRIPDAVHIPPGELPHRAHELPRDRRIVAVCRSGNRSGLATAALRRAGYEVDNLCGGLKAWRASGLPLDPPAGRVA
jgi:rhodanese-related sulfurtransferase